MKCRILSIALVFALCLFQLCMPVLAVQARTNASAHSITLVSLYRGNFTSEVVADGLSSAPYTFCLSVPSGCKLPASISVRKNDKIIEMDEDTTYSYDSYTGEITFASGFLTSDITIRANFPSGTLYVNNTLIYRNNEVLSYLPSGVSFDSATQTLTLDNALIDRGYTNLFGKQYGIYTDLNMLNIALKGTSTISMPDVTDGESYGIYTDGSICITNAPGEINGVLTVQAGNVQSETKSALSCGIYSGSARVPFSFEGVIVHTNGGKAVSTAGSTNSYGLCIDGPALGYGGISFSDCRFSAKGGSSTASAHAFSAGMCIAGAAQDLVYINNSTVSSAGSSTSGEKSAISYGLECNGEVQLDNSCLDVSSGKPESMGDTVFGIGLSCMRLTIDQSELKAQGADNAVVAFGPIALNAEKDPWYQWTAAPSVSYTLSSTKPLQKTEDTVYLHILPISDDQPGETETTEQATVFQDVHVAGHWAKDAVDYVVAEGLFTGTGKQTFSPDVAATRGMIVTVLWRLENKPVYGQGKSGTFTDVPDYTWYTEAVEWATANEIVTGHGDGTFGPDTFITREQLACILWRYAKYKGQDISVGEDTNISSYEDAFDISDYAISALQWACGAGVINGRGDTRLAPQGTATRAEVAQMLKNYLDK